MIILPMEWFQSKDRFENQKITGEKKKKKLELAEEVVEHGSLLVCAMEGDWNAQCACVHCAVRKQKSFQQENSIEFVRFKPHWPSGEQHLDINTRAIPSDDVQNRKNSNDTQQGFPKNANLSNWTALLAPNNIQ